MTHPPKLKKKKNILFMNLGRPITSDHKYRDHIYPLQVARYQVLVTVLEDRGYDPTLYSALAPVCNPLYLETECRKADWVEFYLEVLALGIDLATVPDVTTCEYVNTSDITPGFSGVAASLTTALTGANNDLVFTARERGNDGNLISIAYVVAGNNTPLTIGVVGNAITVNVATGSGGAATSTAAQIRTAVNASAPAQLLLASTEFASGNTGAGIVTALAATFLTGGTN